MVSWQERLLIVIFTLAMVAFATGWSFLTIYWITASPEIRLAVYLGPVAVSAVLFVLWPVIWRKP